MRITKTSIIFPRIDTELLLKAFLRAWLYEKEKSHLKDADDFKKVYDKLLEGLNK